MNARFTRCTVPAAIVCLALAGCATLAPGPGTYIRLGSSSGREVVAGLQARTGSFALAKLEFDCSFTMREEDELKTRSAKALCLWQPGQRVRVRVSHVGMTVADVLYDGRQWYVTLELAARVYICRRISGVRSPNVPTAFFEKLQMVPDGWLADATDNARVEASMARYRITDESARFTQMLEFAQDSAFPLRVDVRTPDGSAFTAELLEVTTNMTYKPMMFAPILEGYEVIDLDRMPRTPR